MYWIYIENGSRTSKMTINMMSEFGVKFGYTNMSDDRVAKKTIGQYGHTEAPVVFYNGTYIGGYKEAKEHVLKNVNGQL